MNESPTGSEPMTAAPQDPPPQPQVGPESRPPGGSVSSSASPPPRRRLHRSTTDRRIGGVAGGIAEYGDYDPSIVRVIMAAVIFFTGIGFFFYLAAWMILPSGSPAAAGHRPRHRTQPAESLPFALDDPNRSRNLIGLIVLAAVIGIAFGSWAAFGLGLIGGGIWLLNQSPPNQAASTTTTTWEPPRPDYTAASTTSAPPPTAAPAQWRSQYEYEADRYGWADLSDVGPESVHVEVQSAPKQRQTITRLTLAGLLLLAALAFSATAGNWWDVDYQRMLGIGLTIVGAGVALGAIVGGRARGLIPLGILGCILFIPVGAVDGFIDDGVGTVEYAPSSLATLEDEYQLGIGEMIVDFTDLDLGNATRTVDISLAAGDLVVRLPPEIGGTATINMQAGDVDVAIPGYRNGNYQADGLNVQAGPIALAGSEGTLLLDIEVKAGAIQLFQESN